MPIEVFELDGGIGNLIRAQGLLSSEEYLDCLKKHLSKDQAVMEKYLYSLSDYTAVTDINITTDDVILIAELCSRAGQFNRHAVVAVAAETDLGYGLSRMWESLCADTEWDIRVFRTLQEARQWIQQKVRTKWGIEKLNFEPDPR
jgi:hypothetical protein